MKIGQHQGELTEQIRRLLAEANPALQRFRGLGTSVAVQKTPEAKPPAQSSGSGVAPSPGSPRGATPRGATPQPSAPISSGPRPPLPQSPGFAPPMGGTTNAKVERLLNAFGSLDVGGTFEPIALPQRPSTARTAERATERAGQHPQLAGRPGLQTSAVDLLQPRPRPVAAEPDSPSPRLPPLDLSGGEAAKNRGPHSGLEPRSTADRAERPANAAPEPRNVQRAELQSSVEQRARLDRAVEPEVASGLDQPLPLRIDPQSAAELQTLIALHAKTGTPFAAALSEIRTNASKTQKRAAKPAATRDERLDLARKARARAYAVTAALFLMALILTLAKSCSGP